MTFWDMLNSHTKVAGLPIHNEDEGHPPLKLHSDAKQEVGKPESPPAKSTWTKEEKQLYHTTILLTTCGRFPCKSLVTPQDLLLYTVFNYG